jgi:predicted ArsR family transcriptional regulator
MPATANKTEEVLASARKELEAQLAVVREELSRLTAEESALTQALTSLDGEGRSAQTDASTSNRGEGSRAASVTSTSRKTATGRRRRRGQSKSTAERVEELRALLTEGPRSRADLAAALKVSPARVQQLLAELGSSVSSQRDPNQRRGKLWVLARQ